MPPSDPAAAAAAAGGSRGSGSGSGTLPPLGAATAATAYTSRPSELAGTLNRSAVVDRSGVAAQRRAARASQEQKHQSAPVAAPQEEYRSLSSGVGLRLPTPLTSRPATSAGTNPFGVSTEGPLSIDLRLASLGSQSARVSPSSDATPYTFSHPHPPSSLAAITQDTNHRVSNFLRHYDGHRRSGSDVMAAPNSPSKIKSHRLLLGHITHLTAAQLEAEQHISRQLSNWHPQRSAKSFAALSSQIRHIISDRLSLFDGGQFTGKTLVEDAGFVSEDIEKKQRQYFRILVPSNVTIVKVDLDVTEGRVDLYVACGEPVNGPPKDRAWSLRGGVGHHSLTLHASDAHFRSGEFFFLTLVAAQTSSVQLKVALGGKNKSLPFDDAPVASGPASSGSRLTARQAAATRHAPSTRNIRKSLEARVRTLMENPKALKEFQRKVAAVRRGQVAGGSSARADERDRSISPDGSPHASEPAATKRAQDSRLPAESGSDRSSSFHRTGVSKPTPPHLLQPQPLTRTTLDHIAHIRSIDGVSAIFYETARELSNPHMLDDHDMILWDDAEATATALRSRAKQANDTDAHSTNPSSPSSSSSATSRQPSQPNSPTSTSRIVVASLQHLIARICARLIIKSRHLDATADLDPWSAEQAHMYRRCATIYEAHLTEIESILRALASPATSTTPLLRALAEPPPPRNFLLANAFDATDNRRFDPAIVDRHRREWLSDHSEKMRQAEERRERILEDRRTQTLAVIDRRERERAEAVASRAAAAARLALQELQRNWLRHLAGTLRHRWLRDARLHLRPMRIESFRKNLAAKRIQTFIRASLALKRKTRANLHFQSFRSLMLLMAANYAAVKRDRAANCIKLFIEQKKVRTGAESHASACVRTFVS